MPDESEATFTCPWWLLFTFDNPLRKWIHDPKKILGPFVHTGDRVLDVGCGMGYFSLGLAELVGEGGRVIAADLQPQMLAGLVKRAKRAGLQGRIQPHPCAPEKIGAAGPLDFALAFWMVHEVRARQAMLQEVYDLLKPGGHFLIVEPLIHVSGADFKRTEALGQTVGFKIMDRPRVNASRAIYLVK
jgi:ubiquinone/menaquinone biosynthesis C-methylase UbiE